ncbi:DUF1684 domain-containing protein [Streptacidiphilus carbonis]|uniref:DUF1684 domain-containing protein n=1 Tax=Streptacidiphilus carbonis TaxID=105422 RepID=UPI0005A8D5D3|nr:DUF1684 domain-containing protein [Streptacidiphilus carbonis]
MSSSLDAWKHWRDDRVVEARAPHGPLALTGTYWLADLREGVPGVPGRWELQGSCVVLTAARHDGVEVDNTPLDGSVRLCPDTAPKPSLLTHGGRRLLLILREGEYAVRVYDPASESRTAFAGIDAHPYAPEWALPARFATYERPRTVAVGNADGRERGLALAGTVAFTAPGAAAVTTLHVSQDEDGGLSAVFADAGSGRDGAFRFRFVSLDAPAADGATVLDLNRAHLPPCAFADHFICPFPPPGNTLAFAVPAGEKRVLKH